MRKCFVLLMLMVFVCSTAFAQYGTSKLYNRSGATVDKYDVVVVDSSNANSFTTTTSERAGGVAGVVWATTIANTKQGRLALFGTSSVTCIGSVALGDYLVTSTTAGSAKSGGTTDLSGAFAIATEAGTNTVIDCILLTSNVLGATSELSLDILNLSDGVDALQFGDDSDIQMGYDEAGDDRFEINDGTNLLAWLTDGGTVGNFGVTGSITILNAGELQLWDSGSSHYIGLEAPALSATQVFVMPNADGPANEVLGTDNSGNLIWRTHDELAGLVANEHIDWTGASVNFVTSGDAAINGGDITSTGALTINANSGGSNISLTGAIVQVPVGAFEVGVNNTTDGTTNIYGDTATTGGMLNFWNGNDHDGITQRYYIQPFGIGVANYLRIGTEDDDDLLTLSYLGALTAAGTITATTGHYAGANDTTAGIILAYGDNATTGGSITLDNAANNDTPTQRFFIQAGDADDGDFHISTEDTADLLVVDDATGNGVFLGDLTLTGGNLFGPIDIGDDTNDTVFAADGFVTMTGTARSVMAIKFGVQNLKIPAANNPGETAIGVTPVLQFDAAADEQVYASLEVPYDWDDGTDMQVYFHWAPVDANAGTVTWGVEYKFTAAENDEILTGGTTTTIVTDDTQTRQDEHLTTAIIALAGSGIVHGEVLHMRIFRDADASEGGADDDYASDASLFAIDVEYVRDSHGEDKQW